MTNVPLAKLDWKHEIEAINPFCARRLMSLGDGVFPNRLVYHWLGSVPVVISGPIFCLHTTVSETILTLNMFWPIRDVHTPARLQ